MSLCVKLVNVPRVTNFPILFQIVCLMLVSFIDDYSKFTWIYLLKFKSEVFSVFQEFQELVESHFDRKILAVQSDWGVLRI